MNLLRRERGQALVLTVLFLGTLILAAAAVIDVGSWYREDRDLQKAMDAAALAGAQNLPDGPAASGLAGEYADKNGGGLDTVEITSTETPDDTITVTGSRPAPGFFAGIIGIDSVTVHATATAMAGVIDEPRFVAPFGVDETHPFLAGEVWDTETTLELGKIGPGAFRILNIDGSHGGLGPGTLADWIMNGYSGDMPLGWYYSDPGAKYNSGQVKDALDTMLGKELLFPVYRATTGSGSGFEYEVVGWTGFVIDSYHFQGSKDATITGHFTEIIWEGISGSEEDAEDYGARTVSLTG